MFLQYKRFKCQAITNKNSLSKALANNYATHGLEKFLVIDVC